jgi:hypothetical protein
MNALMAFTAVLLYFALVRKPVRTHPVQTNWSGFSAPSFLNPAMYLTGDRLSQNQFLREG